MRKHFYNYAIYQNEYPVALCETVSELAFYLGVTTKTIEVNAATYRKQHRQNCKIHEYYDNIDKCYDCSQLYYATKKYEIYRFWSKK